MVITNLANPSKSVFLDIPDLEVTHILEAGLLGMAFHPGYETNGYFFTFRVLFTTSPGAQNTFHTRLSRFRVSADPNKADRTSEVVFIDQHDLSPQTHNAGDLHFGPDGYLYISLGDSTPPPSEASPIRQPIDRAFFGGLLRIDVDMRAGNIEPTPHPSTTTNYLIPADNPYLNVETHLGQAVQKDRLRGEFFAIGFRNPWRFWVDPLTGKIYLGDVGELSWEKINLVEAGKNYGWPYWEYTTPHNPPPAGFTNEPPLAVYLHGGDNYNGHAVVGGLIYRGTALPELGGRYVFGDNVRGNIWSLDPQNVKNDRDFVWLQGDTGLAAFGTDPRDGEILLANVQDGQIKKLIRGTKTGVLPLKLSETGLFQSVQSLEPSAGVIPYEINVPFWSDHAYKKRWFGMPPSGEKIQFSKDGNWRFPAGAVWVKHFELEQTRGVPESRKRVSTRVLVKNNQGMYGVTYRWNEEQTEAFLVPEEGGTADFTIQDNGVNRVQTWRFPSWNECNTCHNPNAGFALGFNTFQLNRKDSAGVNQISKFEEMRLFAQDVPNVEALPAFAPGNDDYSPLEVRARSYLASNCSSCHEPGHKITARWDARMTTPLDQTQILGINGSLNPADPGSSLMFLRMGDRTRIGMPPIATKEPDLEGIRLLTQWVTSFPKAPWTQLDITATPLPQYVEMDNPNFVVRGRGKGFDQSSDDSLLFYLRKDGSRSSSISARLRDVSSVPTGSGGLAIRSSLAPNGAAATLEYSGSAVVLKARTAAGYAESQEIAVSLPVELSLQREGETIKGFIRRAGGAWEQVGEMSGFAGVETFLGLTAASGTETDLHSAFFDSVSTLEASLEMFSPDVVKLPCFVTFEAEAISDNGVKSVTFKAGTEVLAQLSHGPWRWTWANPEPGEKVVTAVVEDFKGNIVESSAIALTILEPDPFAGFYQETLGLQETWLESLGTGGYLIPGGATNEPSLTQVSVVPSTSVIVSREKEEGALKLPDGPYIKSHYTSAGTLSIRLDSEEGLLQRISLFMARGESGPTEQVVTFKDGFTKDALAQRTVQLTPSGTFVSFVYRGNVDIEIAGVNGSASLLNGLFFEMLPLPTGVLTNPSNGAIFRLPEAIPLNISLSEGEPISLNYFVAGEVVAEQSLFTEPVFWRPGAAGDFEVYAEILDHLGNLVRTPPITVKIDLMKASAGFVGEDGVTLGAWKGVYGKEGYVLAGNSTNLPPYVGDFTGPPNVYNWVYSSSPSVLQAPEGAGTIQAGWVTYDRFQVRMSFWDTNAHAVSFYFFDPGIGHERALSISVRDTTTGLELDVQPVDGIGTGKYLTWNVQGDVTFDIKLTKTSVGLFSGIFLDAARGSPVPIALLKPANNAQYTVTQGVLVEAESSGMARLRKIELYSGTSYLGEISTTTPQKVVFPLVGTHTLEAVATTWDGFISRSESRTITVTNSIGAARFLGNDRISAGNWSPPYFGGAYDFFWERKDEPFLTMSHAGGEVITWVFDTPDPRGLNFSEVDKRVAASARGEAISVDVDILDAWPHRVSLYFVDWDRLNRIINVRVIDRVNGTVLDNRTIEDMENGTYSSWICQGALQFQINPVSHESFFSGIFITKPLNQPEDWWNLHFSVEEQQDPEIGGDLADFDEDGFANLVEYALGTNPRVHDDEATAPFARTDGTTFVYSIIRRHQPSDASVIIETSNDLEEWSSEPSAPDKLETILLRNSREEIRFSTPLAEKKFVRFRVERR